MMIVWDVMMVQVMVEQKKKGPRAVAVTRDGGGVVARGVAMHDGMTHTVTMHAMTTQVVMM